MKKFLMFIAGFITASAISFAVVRKMLKMIIEVLAELDILVYFKESLLMTLGKAMGVPDMSFRQYGGRRRPRDYTDTYSYARYNHERKEGQNESRKEQEV